MKRQLATTNEARRALARSTDLGEVRTIRGQAELLRQAARQAGEGMAKQNEWAQVRLLAERRAGELLALFLKHEGGRPRKHSSDLSVSPTLNQLGISNYQSAIWQALARVPVKAFQLYVKTITESGMELTTSGLLGDFKMSPEFNYKRDNKANHPGDPDSYVPQGYDACQTPSYALDPLLPYIRLQWRVWEPAAGEGNLVEAFYDAGWSEAGVIASDILTGQNFFDLPADFPTGDCLVTNPPFSLKYEWLTRCYELDEPFALLLPVETLGAVTAQRLFATHGVQVMLLDKRVNFKMPNKGWEGGGAQFPVAWFTWGLNLGAQLVYGQLNTESPEHSERH